MKYKQFRNTVVGSTLGADVSRQVQVYNHMVVETTCGRVFIDYDLSEFSSLEEARQYLHQQKVQNDIQQEIQRELYEELSDSKVADIIRKYYNVKITDTLIESYVELASSKLFTTNPVAQELRRFNKLDRLIEGHFDYKLDDGTVVVISESTQQQINNVFGQHQDVIEYMRESQENFLSVLNQLEE